MLPPRGGEEPRRKRTEQQSKKLATAGDQAAVWFIDALIENHSPDSAEDATTFEEGTMIKLSEICICLTLLTLSIAIPSAKAVNMTDVKPQSTKNTVPGYLDKHDPIFIVIKSRAVIDLKESVKRSDPESAENKSIATQTWPEDRKTKLQTIFAKSISDYTAQTHFDVDTFMLVFSEFGKMGQKEIAEEYDIRVQYLGGDKYVAEFWQDGLAVNSEAHALAWAHDLATRHPDDRDIVKNVKETYANARKSIEDGKQERYTEVMALLYTVENGGSITFHDPFQPVIDFYHAKW